MEWNGIEIYISPKNDYTIKYEKFKDFWDFYYI